MKNSLESCFCCIQVVFLYLGGWMMITNITTENPSLGSVRTYLDDDPKNLISLETKNFALSSIGLQALHAVTPFTQLRITCYKPSVGRYVDVMTSTDTQGGVDIFNYLVFGIDAYNGVEKFDLPCDSYVALSQDTSKLSKLCPEKRSYVTENTRMYTFPVYGHDDSGTYHVSIGEYDNRYECDDASGSNEGNWVYFVR